MPRIIPVLLAPALWSCLVAGPAPAQEADAPSYRERYRPQFHFSPPRHFMNDPNGLVFAFGEYHLFYQHNPRGKTWGHMSWGHAVGPDPARWENLPVALGEEAGIMVFSGSAVLDRANTSGFGQEGRDAPLVAIYTGHEAKKQTQHIAYSLDRGRTWTKYAGNPVIDLGLKDFRDPKVFWHAPTRRWVMVVSLPTEHRVRFFGSPDLKAWTHLGDFGPSGSVAGVWECPDLFPVPIRGQVEPSRWVLKVDVGSGAVAGGSGGQYFLGDFDGTTFRPDDPDAKPLWVDHGKDFYAAQSWSGSPDRDGRPVWVGWMNNWQYANAIPTHPWRGAMTVPRVVTLVPGPGGLRLAQEPHPALQALRGPFHRAEGREIADGEAPLPEEFEGAAWEIVAGFEPGTADEVGLVVRKGKGEGTRVVYDARARRVVVDRTRSGDVGFSRDFPGVHAAPVEPDPGGRIWLHILVDASSVEVFADQGRAAITDQVFPDPDSRGLALTARGGAARLVLLDAWELRSTWGTKAR